MLHHQQPAPLPLLSLRLPFRLPSDAAGRRPRHLGQVRYGEAGSAVACGHGCSGAAGRAGVGVGWLDEPRSWICASTRPADSTDSHSDYLAPHTRIAINCSWRARVVYMASCAAVVRVGVRVVRASCPV